MSAGLYIHIPFCDHICNYCDFPKLYAKEDLQDRYLDALLGELEMSGITRPKTVYIGGGTPTALSVGQLKMLLDWLGNAIDLTCLEEFTMEANPENLDDEKIDLLLAYGVNRVSLGVQTFHDELLKSIGRTHSGASAIKAIKRLKEKGMPRINLDLIYAIPGQAMEQLEADLETALSLEIEHLSAYSLILEEHTKLYVDYMKDRLELSENDVEASMFELVMDRLAGAGYHHYEVSNFTKGEPSHHNLVYWKNEGYIGCGLGAHGYVNGTRYSNTRSITAYIESVAKGKLPRTDSNQLEKKQQIEEEMFLGLRLLGGVDLKKASAKFATDLEILYEKPLQDLRQRGFIAYDSGVISLTRQGLLMGNAVFEQFLL
ncbi:MAG: radical SAM family heme chaperone HemW [Turicibacter sp.]|nr:radical SAM family heme chaperone HemW [Turicibacter sp.]